VGVYGGEGRELLNHLPGGFLLCVREGLGVDTMGWERDNSFGGVVSELQLSSSLILLLPTRLVESGPQRATHRSLPGGGGSWSDLPAFIPSIW